MTPTKAYFDGRTLVIPEWKFSGKDAKVPHRHRVLASHKAGRTEFFVCSNQPRTLFWVHAVGPGFAGDFSRASLTVSTTKPEIGDSWREAIQSGLVRIGEAGITT